MSPKVCDALIELANKLIEQDIIEQFNIAWCNPVLMVRRPEGEYRLFIDFRKVNMASKKDMYPILFMTEILGRLSTARYISALDLNKAYHQIPLSEESKPIRAFTIPGTGLYQYKRM